MCERNSLDKEASTGCVRETPNKKEASTGNAPNMKKEASMGCVRETPQTQIMQAWDV